MKSLFATLVLLTALLAHQTASASEIGFPTDRACGYLSSISGLGPYAGPASSAASNAGYRLMWGSDSTEDDYFCGTNYKDIGSPAPYGLANNLSYYVRGTSAAAKRLRIMANINQPGDIKDSLVQFEQAVIVLYGQALGKQPSEEILNNIRNVTPSQWHEDGFLVEFQKEVWPTGKGYELNFVIRDPEFEKGR